MTQDIKEVNELLPCPFCGSEDISIDLYKKLWRVHCVNAHCSVKAGTANWNHRYIAVLAWNNRITTKELTEREEKLVGALKYINDLQCKCRHIETCNCDSKMKRVAYYTLKELGLEE